VASVGRRTAPLVTLCSGSSQDNLSGMVDNDLSGALAALVEIVMAATRS
jgi:hypothetical protein